MCFQELLEIHWSYLLMVCSPFHTYFIAAYLMCQDVDVMTNIAWRRGVLLLSILTLLRLLNLYFSLHVGLFDHLHLQKKLTVITAPACYYATVCTAHIPAL